MELAAGNRPSFANSSFSRSHCGIRVDLEAGNRNLPLLQVLLTKILKTCDGLRRFY